MTDRWVVIIVSLLTLTVMCGLLVAAVAWVPARLDRLDERIKSIESFDEKLQVMYNKLAELEDIRKRLGEVRGDSSAAPLARIDKQVDEITVKVNEIVSKVNRISSLAAKEDVDRLAGKISQLENKVSAAPKSDPQVKKLAADVEKLKTLVQATEKSVNKKVDDVTREIKRLNLQMQKLEALIKRIPTEGS